jgi:hypothetical protein
MGKFNATLVEYLERVNIVLAITFSFLSVVRFIEIFPEDQIGAFLEFFSVVGVGILTCGFIAVLCNINDSLSEINKSLKIANRIKS